MKYFRLILFFIFLPIFNVTFADSVAEKTKYPNFCLKASKHNYIFKNFKSDPRFKLFMENISQKAGKAYFFYIHDHYRHLFELFEAFKKNDELGNPTKYEYENFGQTISPTTLRYIKTAGDLLATFGDLNKKHIVEIGGGYGGQCYILSTLCDFASYTIIDLPECNALTKRYLAKLGVKNVHFINKKKLNQVKSYDLVISNYAFSEVDFNEQTKYLKKIIKSTPNGYMMMNFISKEYGVSSLKMGDIIHKMIYMGKKGKLEREKPRVNPNDFLLTWKSEQRVIQEYHPPVLEPGMNAVGYVHGGRLGDALIAFFHAKWIAYKTGLPLVCTPFTYYDHFNLTRIVPQLDFSAFNSIVGIRNMSEIRDERNSTLYIVPYYPECRSEYTHIKHNSWIPFIEVDWDDPVFKADIINCLESLDPVETINLPENMITVGVHIRRGGGYDSHEAIATLPLKFPGDDYYIKQIQRISEIYKDQPIYVYIMTDELNPKAIIENYKEILKNPYLHFDCRGQDNAYTDTMFSDFFTIPKFDCLILCQSNFSIVASKMGNYSVKITPMTHNKKRKIDEIELIFDGSAR